MHFPNKQGNFIKYFKTVIFHKTPLQTKNSYIITDKSIKKYWATNADFIFTKNLNYNKKEDINNIFSFKTFLGILFFKITINIFIFIIFSASFIPFSFDFKYSLAKFAPYSSYKYL